MQVISCIWACKILNLRWYTKQPSWKHIKLMFELDLYIKHMLLVPTTIYNSIDAITFFQCSEISYFYGCEIVNIFTNCGGGS